MTYLSKLKNKNIVVLGAGLTGLSCARFLQNNGIDFSINDNRKNILSDEVIASFDGLAKVVQGRWDNNTLANADVVLVSPGIDLSQTKLKMLINKDAEIFGDVELYCRLASTPMLAVTGSNGKSTVVSLLAHVGKELGKKVQLSGNIGVPVLDQLKRDDNGAQPLDLMIVELSSFQLETLTSMNALAASVLNISDDHLDRHKTLANYTAIKQTIYNQCQNAVINRDDKATYVIPSVDEKITQAVISFGSDKPTRGNFGLISKNSELHLAFGDETLIALNSLPLAGMHNGLNYLAVLALGLQAGWVIKDMLNAFKSFSGLAHRCEKVESADGILWINDSKATNVGATLAAINGIAPTIPKGNQLILIAGGDGKGADFSVMSAAIQNNVSQVLTLGKDGQAIADLTERGQHFSSLSDTVSAARACANSGDVVLLSPACASIDMFKNFVARGEAFSQLVQGGNND